MGGRGAGCREGESDTDSDPDRAPVADPVIGGPYRNNQCRHVYRVEHHEAQVH